MKKKLLAIVVLTLMLYGSACGDALFYGPVCYHIDRGAEHNEVNHIVGLKIDKAVAVTFENSQSKRSWFIGYNFESRKYILSSDLYAKAHLYLGGLYGYDEDMPDLQGWTVGAAPTLEVGWRQYSIEAMFMPVGGGVFSALFNYHFK